MRALNQSPSFAAVPTTRDKDALICLNTRGPRGVVLFGSTIEMDIFCPFQMTRRGALPYSPASGTGARADKGSRL